MSEKVEWIYPLSFLFGKIKKLLEVEGGMYEVAMAWTGPDIFLPVSSGIQEGDKLLIDFDQNANQGMPGSGFFRVHHFRGGAHLGNFGIERSNFFGHLPIGQEIRVMGS